MPKQIKAKSVSRSQNLNRWFAVFSMIAAFLYAGGLSALVKSINDKGDTGSSLFGLLCFAAYVLFLGLTCSHCIHGIVRFGREENYGMLFSSILSGVTAFSLLINIQFSLCILFSAVNEDDIAKKIIGGAGFDSFMVNQRTAWMLMLFGTGLSMFVGMTALIKIMMKK